MPAETGRDDPIKPALEQKREQRRPRKKARQQHRHVKPDGLPVLQRAVQKSSEVMLPEKIFEKRLRRCAGSRAHTRALRLQRAAAKTNREIADAMAQKPKSRDEERQRDKPFGEHRESEQHAGNEERPCCRRSGEEREHRGRKRGRHRQIRDARRGCRPAIPPTSPESSPNTKPRGRRIRAAARRKSKPETRRSPAPPEAWAPDPAPSPSFETGGRHPVQQRGFFEPGLRPTDAA